MNEDGIDEILFTLAKNKVAKSMHKDTRELIEMMESREMTFVLGHCYRA